MFKYCYEVLGVRVRMKAVGLATISGISSILCFTAGIYWQHLTIELPKPEAVEVSHELRDGGSSKQHTLLWGIRSHWTCRHGLYLLTEVRSASKDFNSSSASNPSNSAPIEWASILNLDDIRKCLE